MMLILISSIQILREVRIAWNANEGERQTEEWPGDCEKAKGIAGTVKRCSPLITSVGKAEYPCDVKPNCNRWCKFMQPGSRLFWKNCRIYCLGNQNTVFLCLIELNISEEEKEKTLKGLLYFYASPRRVYSQWQIVTSLLFTLVCACSDPSSLRKHMKSHWLHLFDFSPLCVFKCVLKLPAR